MRSQRNRGYRSVRSDLPRTSSRILTRAGRRGDRHKEKDHVRSALSSNTGHDCPLRNVQLRQEYGTRIREVKISRVKPAAVAPAKGAPALWRAEAMAGQPDRRPGVYGLSVLGGYGYWRAVAVASNWPRSVLRNRASLPLARTSLRIAA